MTTLKKDPAMRPKSPARPKAKGRGRVLKSRRSTADYAIPGRADTIVVLENLRSLGDGEGGIPLGEAQGPDLLLGELHLQLGAGLRQEADPHRQADGAHVGDAAGNGVGLPA